MKELLQEQITSVAEIMTRSNYLEGRNHANIECLNDERAHNIPVDGAVITTH